MMFAQYCRIEARAGGVSCTRREFIRECLKMIRKRSRYSREFREDRHEWIRSGLAMRDDAREEYCNVVTGRFPIPESRTDHDARMRRTQYHA